MSDFVHKNNQISDFMQAETTCSQNKTTRGKVTNVTQNTFVKSFVLTWFMVNYTLVKFIN